MRVYFCDAGGLPQFAGDAHESGAGAGRGGDGIGAGSGAREIWTIKTFQPWLSSIYYANGAMPEVALKDVRGWAKGMWEEAPGQDLWIEIATLMKDRKPRSEAAERAEDQLAVIEQEMGRKRVEVAHWEDEGRWTVLLCFPAAGQREKSAGGP